MELVMRVVSTWALFGVTTLSMSITTQARDEEKTEKKREAEQREVLRKLVPERDFEIATKKANDALVVLLGKADGMELLRLEPRATKEAAGDRVKTF
jgi:hypothetical protein